MAYAFGASSESIIHELVFNSSASWVPPYSCRAYVTVIGPGGSGGSCVEGGDHESYVASGGGAGGCAKSLLRLDSSVTYTINVGAGGASVDNAVGSAGGANSEFQGSDIDNMAGNLGSGGLQGGGAAVVSLKAGGAGGTATGGTIFNCTGGAGGSGEVSAWADYGIHVAAGGGGAAGIFGKSHRGGNALCNTGGANKIALGGGAGVNGNGGDATSVGSTGTAGGGGGSAWGDGESITLVYPNDGNMFDNSGRIVSCDSDDYTETGLFNMHSSVAGAGAWTDQYDSSRGMAGTPASIFHGLHGAPGRKSLESTTRFSGPGAGGSGYWAMVGTQYGWHLPGLFGGGGGITPNGEDSAYGNAHSNGAKGSYGAGGGGNAGYTTSASYAFYSGGGGQGLVVITVVEIL